MKKIKDHFRKADPILFGAIGNYDFPKSKRGRNLFADICEIIIQQQLSERVGDVIYERFKKLFKEKIITPQDLSRLSDNKIRKTGMSFGKISYLKGVATKLMAKEIILDKLKDRSDEEVIMEMTRIKGIGRWSAEMFLMFSLGREDVFSYGDLGLRRAIQKLYKLKKEPTQKEAEKISRKWSPYRTYACLILWRAG